MGLLTASDAEPDSSKRFHILAGLPRAGSTATTAVLKQNPKIWCSETSHVGRLVGALAQIQGQSPEVKGLYARTPLAADVMVKGSQRAMVEIHYGHLADEYDVVIDKSRDWNGFIKTVASSFPGTKVIVCVRDPRNCVASAIAGDVSTGHLAPGPPEMATVYQQANQWLYRGDPQKGLSPGLFGGPITFVEDMYRRNWDNVLFWQYERWTHYPEIEFRRLYEFLELDYFPHDFSDITTENLDCDHIYGMKFRHDIQGPVRPSRADRWRECFDEALAREIMSVTQFYCQAFGYR